MGDSNVYQLNTAGSFGQSRDGKVIGSPRNVAILTADLALNRAIGMCIAPSGFVVTGISFTISDVDTNGTPTHAFTIGDAADPDRLVTTATTGQAGGTLTTLAATGLNYQFPADTEIIMTTTTAAATAAAGTATLNIIGYTE